MTSSRLKSVVVILQGLTSHNRFLQPWRYLTEVAIQLNRIGHDVRIVTDGSADCTEWSMESVPVHVLPSVRNSIVWPNRLLARSVDRWKPDVLVWGVGVTSFLHQRFFPMLGRKQVGIFSSPIYTTQDLAKLGYVRLLRNFDLSGIHILGAITPRSLLQYQAVNSGLDIVVTQTLTTGRKLVQEYGIRQVGTIPPAIDPIWYDSTELLQQEENLCDKNQFIIGYIGPPDVLRGLPRLLSAFANLRSQRRDLKLLILNRKSGQPNDKKTEYIHNQIERLELKKSVELVDGILSPMQLVELCRRADLIALPFEIIPSEAPLSILELRALGKPLVTSQLGCIPELSPGLFAYFAEPGDQHSLENKLWAAIQEVERSSRKEIAQSIPNARRSWEEFGLEWSRLIEA